MKTVVWLFALLVIAAGLLCIVAPDRVLALRWLATTQLGLLGFAVVRMAVGVLLIMIAPGTRAPKILQAAGAVFLFVGLATPFFGVERSRAVLDWEAARPWLLRAAGVFVLAVGGLLAFLLTPRTKSA